MTGTTKGQQLLWRGHSCWCGLECGLTTYSLFETRLLATSWSGNQDSIPTRKIGSIKVRCTIWDMLFGTGTLIFKVEGLGMVTIPHIKNPLEVESLIQRQVSLSTKYRGAYKTF